MTDKEPTEKQLKKFWEWCGFKITKQKVLSANHTYVVCTSSWFNGVEQSLPDLDLNNIFKYAVPKIKHFMLCDWREQFSCNVYTHTSDIPEEDICERYPAVEDTPVLAFFWATEPLWNKENNGQN
jgi:hypothetical protein